MDGGEVAIPCPEFGECVVEHRDGGNGLLPPIVPHGENELYDLEENVPRENWRPYVVLKHSRHAPL